MASQRGNHATASRRVASRRAKVSDDDGREAREMLPPNLLGSENEVSSSIQNFRCENESFEQARTHARSFSGCFCLHGGSERWAIAGLHCIALHCEEKASWLWWHVIILGRLSAVPEPCRSIGSDRDGDGCRSLWAAKPLGARDGAGSLSLLVVLTGIHLRRALTVITPARPRPGGCRQAGRWERSWSPTTDVCFCSICLAGCCPSGAGSRLARPVQTKLAARPSCLNFSDLCIRCD